MGLGVEFIFALSYFGVWVFSPLRGVYGTGNLVFPHGCGVLPILSSPSPNTPIPFSRGTGDRKGKEGMACARQKG